MRILALVASLALALPVGAAAVTIDFESLADVEHVTTQFAGDGITFGNAVTLVSGISLNEFDFPPSSGSRVISGLAAGPITVTFSQGVSAVSLQLTTGEMAAVSYFDDDDLLLGASFVQPNLGSPLLVQFVPQLSSIARLTVANLNTVPGNAFALTVDDLSVTFDGNTPAIPEPTGFLTMACGLVTVAASLRRRT